MRTAHEYRESLRDGRTVYYEGQRVHDVTTHPILRIAVDHAALDYEMAEDGRYRSLAVVPRPGGGEMSRFFAIPRTAEDLLARSELIETGTRLGGTVVPLLKEIGTDALFALQLVAHEMDGTLGTHYPAACANSSRAAGITTWPWPWPKPTSKETAAPARAIRRTLTTICGSWTSGPTASSSAAPKCIHQLA